VARRHLAAAPDFDEHARSAAREAVLVTTDVGVAGAKTVGGRFRLMGLVVVGHAECGYMLAARRRSGGVFVPGSVLRKVTLSRVAQVIPRLTTSHRSHPCPTSLAGLFRLRALYVACGSSYPD
jgi:hypothetical protein